MVCVLLVLSLCAQHPTSGFGAGHISAGQVQGNLNHHANQSNPGSAAHAAAAANHAAQVSTHTRTRGGMRSAGWLGSSLLTPLSSLLPSLFSQTAGRGGGSGGKSSGGGGSKGGGGGGGGKTGGGGGGAKGGGGGRR
jgi:hypothetical protein